MGKTEGADKGNNYLKDQLPMGGSRGSIFIDQYWGIYNGMGVETLKSKENKYPCEL